jgi:predicted dehydrogenase
VIKPLAQRRAEAEAMYGAAARHGVFLGLGYERCFLPAADELRRLVKDGTLGRIIHTEGAYCVGRYFNMTRDDWKTDSAVVPPGALADHMLYMMVELLGPVAELYARGHHHATDLDVADTAAVTFRFAAGASGLLTAMGVTADFSRLHVFGTEGWAEIRGSSHLELAPRKGERTVTEFPAFDTLRAQLERFAAAAKGETPFPVSPETAIASVAALEAMGRSAESDGPVSV